MKCQHCPEPSTYVTEFRKGNGTTRHYLCWNHVLGKKDMAPGMAGGVPVFKRNMVGEWGLVLRRIAGM